MIIAGRISAMVMARYTEKPVMSFNNVNISGPVLSQKYRIIVPLKLLNVP